MFFIVLSISSIGLIPTLAKTVAQEVEPAYTTEFRLGACKFKTRGENPYFILEPGYQWVLEEKKGKDTVELQIIVLDETRKISVEIDGESRVIKTRVVEEREWVNGELFEVARNFYAICKKSNSVYNFGEEVDMYKDGAVVSHDGAWLAGVKGAVPVLLMPGTFLLGSRYFQEQAWKVAMDRGENADMGLTIDTPAGHFEGCVEVFETNPLDPKNESAKIYCPGVGLVMDDELRLVRFGKTPFWDDDDTDNDNTYRH